MRDIAIGVPAAVDGPSLLGASAGVGDKSSSPMAVAPALGGRTGSGGKWIRGSSSEVTDAIIGDARGRGGVAAAAPSGAPIGDSGIRVGVLPGARPGVRGS